MNMEFTLVSNQIEKEIISSLTNSLIFQIFNGKRNHFLFDTIQPFSFQRGKRNRRKKPVATHSIVYYCVWYGIVHRATDATLVLCFWHPIGFVTVIARVLLFSTP